MVVLKEPDLIKGKVLSINIGTNEIDEVDVTEELDEIIRLVQKILSKRQIQMN